MNKLIEGIFLRVPGIMRDLLVSAYGLNDLWKRERNYGRQHLERLRQLATADLKEVEAYQHERLSELLIEAFDFSSHYRRLFEGSGIPREAVIADNPFVVLDRLPLLEKQRLRDNLGAIVSVNPRRRHAGVVNTSGTTGSPMRITVDSMALQSTRAEWLRYYEWMGLPIHFRSVRLSGRIIIPPLRQRPPFWAYNATARQLFMSSYHLTEGNLPAYIDKLQAFKPVLIDGYPSACHVFAQYMLRKKIQLSFKPRAISLTAETLMDHQRDAIEQAFGCKVYNQYASSEGAPWIVECHRGHYHLWLDTGVFEFINRRSMDGETDIAELVVTSFRNFKTPLIRYRIGDWVKLYKEPSVCACGAPYPIIAGIIGRDDDILFTEVKGSVGRMDPAYKGIIGIRQSKIIQHSLTRLEVLVVADDDFDDKQRALLLRNLRDRLGHEIRIDFNFQDSISLGRAGKFKSVERRFPLPEIG